MIIILTLDTDTVQSIPTSVARMYNVLAVASDDTSVTLATSDLIDPRVSDELAFVLTKEVRFVMAREQDVHSRISQYYGDDTDSVADMLKSLGSGMDQDDTLKSDPYYGDILCKDGDASFPFKVVIVKDQLSQLLLLALLTRLINHPVDESRLSMVHMGDDSNIPYIHNPLTFSSLRAQ